MKNRYLSRCVILEKQERLYRQFDIIPQARSI